MSAGSVSPTDLRGDSFSAIGQTASGAIKNLIEARQIAKEERKFAEKKAWEQGIDKQQFDSMFGKGFFFRKAVIGKFGGDYVKERLAKLNSIYRKVRIAGKSVTNPRLRERALDLFSSNLNQKFSSSQKKFRSKFDYTDYEDYFASGGTTPKSKAAKTRTPRQPAVTKPKVRATREDILSSIDKFAESIAKTAEAVSKSSAAVQGTIVSSGVVQTDVKNLLIDRSNSLESKLDQLINAVKNQTVTQAQYIQSNESAQREARQDDRLNVAATVRPDDLETKEDESAVIDNMGDPDMNPPGSTSPGSAIVQNPLSAYEQRDQWRNQMMGGFPNYEMGTPNIRKISNYEAGNQYIMDGPDSGYLAQLPSGQIANLHGKEMVSNVGGQDVVVPMDNNYTQGQPSAVDGKVRAKPDSFFGGGSMPSRPMQAEMGSKNIKPIQAEQGVTVRPSSSDTNAATSSDMLTVMALPSQIAGATVSLATNQYAASQAPPEIAPQVRQMSQQTSNVFGVPPSIARATEAIAPPPPVTAPPAVEQDSPFDLGKVFSDFFGWFKEKLGFGSDDNGDADDGGGGGAGGATGGPTAAGDGVAGKPPNTEAAIKDLGTFIGNKETTTGSYTKLVGGKEDPSILNKTVSQLESERGGQFAMGKYQIQMRTAREVLTNKGIDPTTFKFNEAGQDQLYKMLLERRGLDDFLSGKIDENEFATNLAKEWASMPVPEDGNYNGRFLKKGQSYYAGDGSNAALTDAETVLQYVRNLRQTSPTLNPAAGGMQGPPIPDYILNVNPSATSNQSSLNTIQQVSQVAMKQKAPTANVIMAPVAAGGSNAGSSQQPDESAIVGNSMNPLMNSGIFTEMVG